MKIQAYFIRSAPYEYLIPGKDLYDSFNDTIQKRYNPSIKKGSVAPFKAPLVYYSPERRCFETARLISKNIKQLSLLEEISYQMEDFISKDDFYSLSGKPNLPKARQYFMEKFINNQLQESYQEVIGRIKRLLLLIIQANQGKIVLVSHGFYLKVIEAYVKDKRVEIKPRRLLNYFDNNVETFKSNEGFKIIYDQNRFKIV